MSDDKMRAEFEEWAESQDCIAHRSGGGSYWHPDVTKMWRVWQAAYAAGQKAEREDCAKACEDAAKGTKVELIGIGFAEMLRNRQEEK